MSESRPVKVRLVILWLVISLPALIFPGCGEEAGIPQVEEPSHAASASESTPESEVSSGAGESFPSYESSIFSLADAYSDYFLLGTIYTPKTLSDPEKSLVLGNFNCITPENIMKPEYMQPTEGNFNFTESDTMMQFAGENNLKVVGHTLVWHQQSGDWLGRNVTREEAIEQLRNHITSIVSRYRGKVLSWDVVNEAVDDGKSLPADGDWTKCLRETQWLSSIGPDYIALAFTFAHEADPDAKLYYNDYNLNDSKKAEVVCAMVRDLKSQGVPIDGIGMQGHYTTNVSVASVERSLKMFSELGVEVSISELDVAVNDAAGAKSLTREQEIRQAVTYAKLFKVFKKYSDLIKRVTFWGTVDSASWRSDRFPCLFNGDYTPKEAVYAVLDPEKYLSDIEKEE